MPTSMVQSRDLGRNEQGPGRATSVALHWVRYTASLGGISYGTPSTASLGEMQDTTSQKALMKCPDVDVLHGRIDDILAYCGGELHW